MQGLYSQLSETHGIALRHCVHEQELERVKAIFTNFGVLSSYEVYYLNNKQFLSIAHFAEPHSCEMCFHALRSFIDSNQFPTPVHSVANTNHYNVDHVGNKSTTSSTNCNCALIDVGWVNEENNSSVSSKEYVLSRYQLNEESEQVQENNTISHVDRYAENGYLIAFWSRLSSAEREVVYQTIKPLSLEVFTDDVQGGRCFMRFADEATADEVWDVILQKTQLSPSELSYGTLQEFILAKH